VGDERIEAVEATVQLSGGARNCPSRPDMSMLGLLMENLQSLIAQLLGVAFALLGKLND
jgi:hypothetical protein